MKFGCLDVSALCKVSSSELVLPRDFFTYVIRSQFLVIQFLLYYHVGRSFVFYTSSNHTILIPEKKNTMVSLSHTFFGYQFVVILPSLLNGTMMSKKLIDLLLSFSTVVATKWPHINNKQPAVILLWKAVMNSFTMKLFSSQVSQTFDSRKQVLLNTEMWKVDSGMDSHTK